MEKVFIVTEGDYSDYSIRAVFSTRRKAKAFVTAVGAKHMEVEVWQLDDPALPATGHPYIVDITEGGDTLRVERVNHWFGADEGHRENIFWFYVWARDEAHAVKIANERRSGILARKAATGQ